MGGYHGGWIGLVVTLLVVTLLVVPVMVGLTMVVGLTVWRHADRRFQQRRPDLDSSERLLAMRYARGEIDEEEYHDRLAVLRQQGLSALSFLAGGPTSMIAVRGTVMVSDTE